MVARNVRIAIVPRASSSAAGPSRWRRRTDSPRLLEPGAGDDLHEARGLLVALLISAACFAALFFAVRLIVR